MGTDVTVTSIKHGMSGGRGTARGSRVYSHWIWLRSEEEQGFQGCLSSHERENEKFHTIKTVSINEFIVKIRNVFT